MAEENNKTLNYPDEFASNYEKKQKEYGAIVGKMISQHWFGGHLTQRRIWIDKMRAYSRGEQCTEQYKETIEGSQNKKDNTQLKRKNYKIDYKPLKIFSAFKDILVNPIDESLFKPRAESVDVTAINRKKDYLESLEDDFYTRDIADIVSQGIGVNITKEDSPKNIRDLEARKLEFKPKLELAQELAIHNVMKSEKFETIKDSIDPDLVDLGIGVGRHYTDTTEGIKFKYVDPYNFLHSPFEMEDGRDIRYFGITENNSISNWSKMAGGISEDDLKKLKVAIGQPESTVAYSDAEDGHRTLEGFSFSYLVSENRVFKKLRTDNSIKIIDRTEDDGTEKEYNPKNSDKKIFFPFNVWYEGIYIPKADVILKWEKIPNQAEGGVNKPLPPFIIYAPKVKKLSEKGEVRFDSLVERAIPFIDDIHRDYYKLQQLKMELRPNTVTINPRTLNNTMLNGTKIDGKELLDLYFGRGVLIADEYDDDGEKIATAINENNGGMNNNSLLFLSNEFTRSYDKLRQVIGINEVRDGTTKPNSKTAVTVQKLLLASSNNSTNHIVKASFNISLRFAEATSSRLIDVMNTPALKNRYIDIIGTDNVELLNELKKYPMSKFAIYFDFKPDNEERLNLERSLIESFNKGEINVAQYNQARLIQNTKSAIKYLEYIIEINRVKKAQENLLNIREQAKANAETSKIIEEQKVISATKEYEIMKQKMLLETSIKAQEQSNQAKLNELQKQRDHVRALEILSLENANKEAIEDEKEEARNERIDQQSTNTSKIADQKANNKPPIDFENSIDDIFKSVPLPNTL